MEIALISKRIRQYRHLAKLTQEGLADRMGISDTYIRKLEAGKRIPSLELILRLAEALDTTPDYLLLGSNELGKSGNSSIWELLSDCSPTEFIILYENMAHLKELLREHLK